MFNEGYSGDVDLAAEAIRLTRELHARTDDPEVAGLLALMLLHHARRPARTRADGSLVALAEQDRGRWDTALIAEGVAILQRALARDRLGEFQAQAAIAALHADAQRAEETDWVQIVEWYDELVRLTDSPIARLNRAVAVGEADGARAGLAPSPSSTRRCRATRRSPRTSTTAAGTRRPPPASTPRRPPPRRTSRSATTSRARRRGSTPGCAAAGRRAPRRGAGGPGDGCACRPRRTRPAGSR